MNTSIYNLFSNTLAKLPMPLFNRTKVYVGVKYLKHDPFYFYIGVPDESSFEERVLMLKILNFKVVNHQKG